MHTRTPTPPIRSTLAEHTTLITSRASLVPTTVAPTDPHPRHKIQASNAMSEALQAEESDHNTPTQEGDQKTPTPASEGLHGSDTLHRCVHCGQHKPLSSFTNPLSPICQLDEPPLISSWNPASLDPKLKAKLNSLPYNLSCWLAIPRTFCTGKKQALNWHVGAEGCLQCKDEHVQVLCYLRFSGLGHWWLNDVLVRKPRGGLEVIELTLDHCEIRRVEVKALEEVWCGPPVSEGHAFVM